MKTKLKRGEARRLKRQAEATARRLVIQGA
jgi:hypothetical protein